MLDARYAALVANGFAGIERTAAIKTWVAQRRSYLEGRLKSEDVPALEITSNNGAGFSTNGSLATLSGRAPLAVATIEVNGVPYPVTWTTVNTWSLSIPLAAPTNVLRLVGYDLRRQPVPGAADEVTIRYTGTPPSPAGFVVIHEIMFDPPAPGAGFVEIRNTSPTGSFDLSGWRLEGTGFEFPAGTVLRPGSFLVVAANLAAFRAAYGNTVVPVGEFPGALQDGGELLQLVRPGATPDLDQVVDAVRYDSEPPWPVSTRGGGPSLQLIDAAQDNRRPANWAAVEPGGAAVSTPGAANSVASVLDPFPTVWINEVQPANPDGARDGAGEREPWVELFNPGTNVVDLAGLFLSADPLRLTAWSFPAGTRLAPGRFLVVWCDGETSETTPGELHAGFRLDGTADGVVVLSRLQAGAPAALDALAWKGLPAGKAWGLFPDGDPFGRRLFHTPTPGAANSLAAPLLQVTFNEWMASNGGSVLDPADGDPDDWFELHNAGAVPADLSAFTLTDDLTVPGKVRLPNGTVIPPGGFLVVWADDEPNQNAPGRIHAGFRLSAGGETLGLFAPDGAPVDAVSFGVQSNNVAQGRFPDGGPEPFVFLSAPTPGTANLLASANHPPVLQPITVAPVDEGGLVTFTAQASDADAGQTLTFALQGAPAGATLDPATGVFRWVTTEADGPATVAFSVRVTDSGTPPRSASQPVNVAVREVNREPRLEPVADRAVDEGTSVVLTVAASDPDLPAQRLTFSLDPGAPAGAAVHPQTGEFAWTPAEDQGPATYRITVRVADDGVPALSATVSFQVTVREVDNPPVFDLVGVQSIDEGLPFELSLVARDPDTPPRALAYSLVNGPSGATVDPGTGRFRWTPDEASGPGSFPVLVRAAESGGGLESTLSFSVVVNERNEAPVLEPLSDHDLVEGGVVTFRAVAADADVPAQRLGFSLDPGAPPGAWVDAATGVFTWPVPEDQGASTNRITLRVSDGAQPPLSAAREFQVVVRPRLRLVINEIMYAPAAARTEFVELANLSGVTGWDLGGWRLTGLDFAFAPGTRVEPGQFLVVARDVDAFRRAYPGAATVVGNAAVAFGTAGPQWVRLQRPAGGAWETVDEVAFHRDAPWPAAAAGGGASLQLRDAAEDNRRVANWAALAGATTNAPVPVVGWTQAWRYKQDGPAPANWREPSFNDAAWPSGRGLLVVEDAALPAPKSTLLTRTEGRMTYYFRTRFTFAGQPDGASLVLSNIVDDGFVLHLNGREIFRLGMAEGTTVADDTAASRTVGDATIEGPFRIPVTNLVAGENVLAAEVHQVNTTSSDIVWGASVDVLEVRRESATPGYANSVRLDLPPFPGVWIHEVLPRNDTGPSDNAGEREPWIELSNLGDAAADLEGWYLTDDFSQLTRWRLPAGASLDPGAFRLVWADAEPAESTPSAWHASFRPAFPRGTVALVRDQPGGPAVVDFLAYEVLAGDQSVGISDPADPLGRGLLAWPTPGAPNPGAATNRPPELDPIADQTLDVGNPWSLTVKAREPDAGQRLSYRLAPGAPAGAGIGESDGVLRWTPTPGQEGASTWTVVVRDDGVPPLEASRSFRVTVRPSTVPDPVITGLERIDATRLRLAWVSVSGRRYGVESAPGVSGPWAAEGTDQVATGTSLQATLVVGGDQPARYYRVVRRD